MAWAWVWAPTEAWKPILTEKCKNTCDATAFEYLPWSYLFSVTLEI